MSSFIRRNLPWPTGRPFAIGCACSLNVCSWLSTSALRIGKQHILDDDSAPSRAEGPDLTGVLAVAPAVGGWPRKPAGAQNAVSVTRTQIPLLPQKQCTFHGIQGKTADPGFIAHWQFPAGVEGAVPLARMLRVSVPPT